MWNKPINSTLPMGFVIMPFHPPFNEYYDEIIRPAVQKAGLLPQRADEILGAGAFMEDVVKGILSSKVIVAELTGRNANVFYELGLAHGLRKPVIMLTQDEADIPSDLRSLKWIKYGTISPRWSTKLRRDLTNSLQAMLEGNSKDLIFPFVHPSDALETQGLLKTLGNVSGTQKQFIDYIKECNGPVNQRDLEKRFALFSPSELFYRLECLRLLGFLVSTESGRDSSGKPVYLFDLSHAAKLSIASV